MPVLTGLASGLDAQGSLLAGKQLRRLLHTAGTDVQDIFFYTVTETGKDFKTAKEK